jgi:peptidyl-dipeptidase Dcp
MFRNFAGREPDVTPMLEARGLVPGDAEAADETSDGKLPEQSVED